MYFISIVNHAMSAVFGVVFTFSSECQLVFRERAATMYRARARAAFCRAYRLG